MENNELQLVTFEQAQRLKKAGFDWPTIRNYSINGNLGGGYKHRWDFLDDAFLAPTVALALKWMRDVKEIECGVGRIGIGYRGSYGKDIPTGTFDTHESAESALLDELLTLIEK